MPVKKSYLIETSKFHKAVRSNNLQVVEKNLQELMNQANDIYNKTYNDSKNDPDIDKFNACRINFSQIKSISESEANSTPLINKIYLEAWISALYSEVHALNLQPETEKQLNELNEKIQAISIEFTQLITKRSSLDSKDESSIRLLKYIANFEETWKTKKKRLLADATFNFAETLVEQSNFQSAFNHFERSKNLYEKAAIVADNTNKKTLLEFSKQTIMRLQEIKNMRLENRSTELVKELNICLQRLPDFPTEWTIVKEAPSQSMKKKDNLSSKIKRKSNEEYTYPGPKKQKLGFRTLDFKKILDKFNDLNININLSELTNTKKSFDERRAIVHNNYAIYLIEDLNNKDEIYTHCQKLKLLKKVEQILIKSTELYKKASLVKEKDKIIECITTINSCQDNLKTQIQSSVHQKDSTIKTQEFPTKSLALPKDKMRQYQTIFSTRLAYKFFNTYLPEDNVQTAKPIIKNISP